ncbi:MAG: DUF305 domain-containing protein [Nakamurella sp.]
MSGPPTSSVFQRWGRNGTAIVMALAAVILLLIGGTIGLALGGSPASSAGSAGSVDKPAVDSVDVGFLRDMGVHHEQGVLLAHLVQLNGGRAEVAGVGYDIEYQQTSQIGQMGGFLQLWGYSLNNMSTPMSWMTSTDMNTSGPMAMMTTMDAASVAAGAVMPGMATNAEVDRLKTLRGDASDAYFLQLMIRHHEGGVPMMDYAATYATNPVVKNMALKMAQGQVAEIASMTQLLQGTYGGHPLITSGVVASDSTTGTAPGSSAGMTGMDVAPTS